jgi:tight adherence protein B
MKRFQNLLRSDKAISLKWVIIYGAACWGVASIFFQKYIRTIPFFLIGILMERSTAADRRKKEQREELKQFREFIELVNGSMTATSKAVEKCVDEAIDRMEAQHMDKTKVFRELKNMQTRLTNNTQASFTAELTGVAERLDNKEIMNFANSVSICYEHNSQGITSIIRNTSTLIQEKSQIEDEIYVAIAEARNQALIMLLMPSVIILFLKHSMPSFFGYMNNTSAGLITLSVCLAVNYITFFIIQKIIRKGA